MHRLRPSFAVLAGALLAGALLAGAPVPGAPVPVAVAAAPPPAGVWAPPLAPPLRVVRPFVAPSTPYGPGHRGVDLGAPAGSAVRSPGDGTVRFAGPVAGRGVVSVDAGGLRFTYEPVLPRVRAGQQVGRGAVLGSLVTGHPGCRATAGQVCLHWGVRLGARYLDPLRPVAARVRLLPVR